MSPPKLSQYAAAVTVRGNADSQAIAAAQLVQEGKALYEAQDYAQANQRLEQAVQAYTDQGDRPRQSQTLVLQSLVLQKLGDWETAQTRLDQSFALLQTLTDPSRRIRAQAFNAQGQLYFAIGQARAAFESWEAAEGDYSATGEILGETGSRINQVQALGSLGLYHRAAQILADVEGGLQALPNSATKATALLNLGNVLRLRGELARSHTQLLQGLDLAQSLDLQPLMGQLFLSLGNTERIFAARAIALNGLTKAQIHTQLALGYYQQAAAAAPGSLTQLEADLNQLSLLVQQQDWSQSLDPTGYPDIWSLVSTLDQTLPQLPPSRGAVYAQINFAHSLMALKDQLGRSLGLSVPAPSLQGILSRAIAQATTLADDRAIAYALGTAGTWRETQQNWGAAKQLTNTALQRAQSIRATDMAYQWQWQMGRIVQAEADAAGDPASQPDALRYYTGAVATLDTLRADLIALNPDVQYSFREQVEPVYRELVALLLRGTPSQDSLRQALEVVESLQLAELDNFFRNACAQPQAVTVSTIDPNTAVLYPILLDNRLDMILQLTTTVEGSDQHSSEQGSGASTGPSAQTEWRHAVRDVPTADVVQVATDLQRHLRLASTPTSQIKAEAQQLYDWLIRPFETELDAASQRSNSPVKTLTFVLDGPLRNLPMAVLHDGDRYLVERYAIAVAPGLQLLDPQPLQRQPLNVLLGGAVDAPSFEHFALAPLANVDRELEAISAAVADSQRLKGQAFLQRNIREEIAANPFNVVHLATHGKFSSNPEQTFILDWQQPILAPAIDSLLSIADPQRAIDNPIELLVLSACETAAGDSRAALGLAGVAIRAGARSTLATLWQVNDASTAEFMVRFYRELSNAQVTKAEALRNVQLSFLADDARTRYPRPNRWAPFILVGNWL